MSETLMLHTGKNGRIFDQNNNDVTNKIHCDIPKQIPGKEQEVIKKFLNNGSYTYYVDEIAPSNWEVYLGNTTYTSTQTNWTWTSTPSSTTSLYSGTNYITSDKFFDYYSIADQIFNKPKSIGEVGLA